MDEITQAEQDAQFEERFIEQFDITVGEVPMTDEDTGETKMMWKAVSDDASVTSGTIFDAVMGCIEEQTGGEV